MGRSSEFFFSFFVYRCDVIYMCTYIDVGYKWYSNADFILPFIYKLPKSIGRGSERRIKRRSSIPVAFLLVPQVKPEGTIGLHSVRQSVPLSVRPSHSFSGLFFAMLWRIWMKVGSKLLYEELQIKFDFHHDWPTFSWVIALCSKFVFRTFLDYALTYLNESC